MQAQTAQLSFNSLPRSMFSEEVISMTKDTKKQGGVYKNTGFDKGPDQAYINRYVDLVKKRNSANKPKKK